MEVQERKELRKLINIKTVKSTEFLCSTNEKERNYKKSPFVNEKPGYWELTQSVNMLVSEVRRPELESPEPTHKARCG